MRLVSVLSGVVLAVGFVAALGVGCGGSNKTVSFDLGDIDISVPSDCASLSQCIAFCAVDGGTSTTCVTACRATATTAATQAFDAITTCVSTTCGGELGDSGSSICSDTSSVECMRCETNSRYKDAADCTGAPSYCGACSTEQVACTGG